MSLPRLQGVVAVIRRSAGGRDEDREALLAAVASATGVEPVRVRAGRVCPHCGATDHGRPWAEVDGSAVGVSLARTTGLVALAVGPPGIGVDLERVSRVAASPLDAFTPGEFARSSDAADRAACWAVKEAVLKRDGRGLRVDPTRVDVDLGRGTATLDGVVQSVTVVFPADDVVLAVAAGGNPVSVGA